MRVYLSSQAMNDLVLNRLKSIQSILIDACGGGDGMAAASVGTERESFINLVLSNVIAPPFRVGTGEITDREGRTSGQLDVVIEYASSLSFPLLRGDSSRLYLGEGIGAVVEIKSDVSHQWKKVVEKAEKVAQLERNPGAISEVYPPGVPQRVPFFVVSYKGWADAKLVSERVEKQANTAAPIDGMLVIKSGIYRGRNPEYSDHNFDGPWALYGFLLSIEQITSSMLGAKPAFKAYAE